MTARLSPEQMAAIENIERDLEMALVLMQHSGTDPMAWIDSAKRSIAGLLAATGRCRAECRPTDADTPRWSRAHAPNETR